MPASVEPRSGLNYGWGLGESGWNVAMDANLLTLGRFGFHLSVRDRDLSAPPANPAAGDSYIVAAPSSGDWAGLEGRVVVWTGSAWASATPRPGWLAYIEDEEKLAVFKPSGWSAGVGM